MTFPAYPEYKESGVEWIGKVPEHWHVKRINTIATLNDEVLPESTEEEYEIAYVDIGSVSLSTGIQKTERMKFKDAPSRARRLVKDGDVIVSTVRTYLKAIAPVVKPQENLVVSTGFAVIRGAEHLYSSFSKYALQSNGFVDEVISRSTGVSYPAINSSEIGLIKISVPSVDEQKTIANFLDYETEKIDALIAEQEKLIELLNEKRQSIISNAVCRGLDPNVPMKDSGVEWLGMVPEHWNVKALKHIVSIPITDGPHETPEFVDEGVPFVSAEAVSSGVVDFAKIRGFISRDSHEKYSLKYVPKRGDIFMVKSGATTGICAIVETDDEFNIWSPLAVIRCMEEIEPYFVLNYMRSLNFQEAIALNWNFGTQQNIGMGVIENLMLPVPPHCDQIEISKMLSDFLNESNALISEASIGIALLKERRSALISAAVCGQIDVRNFHGN